MTDYVDEQEWQQLLQRRGCQYLTDMVAAMLQHGLRSTFLPPQASNISSAGREQSAGTESAMQRLQSMLQAHNFNAPMREATRGVEKSLFNEVDQVFGLLETLHDGSQLRLRDSGAFVLGTDSDGPSYPPLHTSHQNNSYRYASPAGSSFQSSMSPTTSHGAHGAAKRMEVSWSPSRTAAPPSFPYHGRAPIHPSYPINLSRYEQQKPSQSNRGPNGQLAGPGQSSSLERWQSPTMTYTSSISGSNPSSPHHLIGTDMPALLSPSIQSTLHQNFKHRPGKFFKVGRVFMVLWSEPEGSTANPNSVYSFPVAYGERVQAKIRRFIVIVQREQHSLAIPILSHQDQGVANRNFDRRDHGIVYMGSTVPEPGVGETGMLQTPIRVIPDEPTEKLKDTSRIHFGKVYTIEHNVKAKGVGMVHDGSREALLMQQYEAQWRANLSMMKRIRETRPD